MESADAQGKLAAIMDFSMVEVSNEVHGSMVSCGQKRLRGHEGTQTPRIMAAGGVTVVDFQTWGTPPIDTSEREVHIHNRLISCVAQEKEDRIKSAKEIALRANENSAKNKAFIVLKEGIDEWDKEGGPFHNPAGLQAFNTELIAKLDSTVTIVNSDAHINDDKFSQIALEIFDNWVKQGIIPAGQR